MTEALREVSNPAALVAIAKAAHENGDRELERSAKRLLLEQHGIGLTFRRVGKPSQEGGK